MFPNIKRLVVADIECNGLPHEADRVWCLSYFDYLNRGSVVTLTDTKDIVEFINGFGPEDVIVMHNGVLYDLPELKRLIPETDFKGKIWDTLGISRYLYPKRQRHGLELWGEEVGIPKVEILNWKTLPLETYVERCSEDVKINTKIFHNMIKDCHELYDGNMDAVAAIFNFHTFKYIAYQHKQRNKIKVDIPYLQENLAILQEEYNEKVEILKEIMPEVPVYKTKKKPAKLIKKDGSLNSMAEKWYKFLEEQGLPKDTEGPVKYVSSYKEPNPGSNPQIKEWLEGLGWTPETFKYVKNKDTGDVRMVPQVRKEVDGVKELCSSVLKLTDKEPGLKALAGITLLEHRLGILKGFMRDMDEEGFIAADIGGITSTWRTKHRTIVNLPSVDKPYGKIIRGCLIARPGKVFIGSDLSGLENATKLNFLQPIDPDYVAEMNDPTYDPHLALALLDSAVTQREVDFFKWVKQDKTRKSSLNEEQLVHLDRISTTRQLYKQVVYSLTYGAGAKTLARNCGIPETRAKRLISIYKKQNWAQEKFAKSLKTKQCLGVTWVFNPLTKFWYELRSSKDLFSATNQGSGAMVTMMWIKQCLDRGVCLITETHDDLCIEEDEDKVEEKKAILQESIDVVNQMFGFNIPMTIDIQVGKRFSEIH